MKIVFYQCSNSIFIVDDSKTLNWLTHDDTCYQKCDFHGGRCEKVCGEDGFCCNGDIFDRENQDCPLIARLSVPRYKNEHVCVQKGLTFISKLIKMNKKSF